MSLVTCDVRARARAAEESELRELDRLAGTRGYDTAAASPRHCSHSQPCFTAWPHSTRAARQYMNPHDRGLVRQHSLPPTVGVLFPMSLVLHAPRPRPSHPHLLDSVDWDAYEVPSIARQLATPDLIVCTVHILIQPG